MGEQFANNAATTLSASATDVATTISVASSTPFPTATNGGQFRILVDTEYMIVTAISGTTWTVARGAEGSTAAAHSSGATVTHVVTAGALNNGPWGGGDYFVSGQWNYGLHHPTTVSNYAGATGRMFVRPYPVPVRRSFDRIGAWVTAAATAGGLLRMGIYGPGGSPGNLILDAGTVDATTTGAKEITISITLDPGIYWLAAAMLVAGCSLQAEGRSLTPWQNFSALQSDPTSGLAPYATGVTGALPSTFTPSGFFVSSWMTAALRAS